MKRFLAICLLLLSVLGYGAEGSEANVSPVGDFSHIHLKDSSTAGYLHIPRDRGIDNSTYLYVKYALETFRKEKVAFVLLDLNTPGGEVFAALRISEELKKMDREYQIPVIAFVDNWALSAGALLAYSCRYIGAVTEASMGAAEPVTVGSDGKMETASEKMVSALRTEFASAASLYGRDPLIAQSMVDRDIVLVLRKGKIVELVSDDQIITKGSKPDVVIKAKGKLLTLDTKGLNEYGVSDFTVPEMTREGAAFLAGEKLAQEPFFKDVKITWIPYKNWNIDVFAFLSNPIVSSFLMMGLMIGLYGAIQSQGFGFTSILGVICLSLIIVSAFATQLIGWLEIVAVLLGILFIILDLTLIAGFGILGALGILLFLFGLIAMLLPPLQGFSWTPSQWGVQMDEWVYRLSLFLFVILLFFAVVIPLGGHFFRRSFSFKRLVLQEPEQEIPEENKLPEIGSEGVCFSVLRPFGKVQLGDIVYEALTEGELIPFGAKIEVIAHKKKILIVKEKT